MSRNEDEPVDPPVDRGPGRRLQAAREARGLSLDQAGEALGIARHLIQALEEDDFERVGAPVYVRGYLRKYARYLGLTGDELVAEYEALAVPHDPEVHAHATSGLPRHGGLRWLAPAAAGLAVVIIVLAGLWVWQRVRVRTSPANPPAAAVSAAMALTRAVPTLDAAGASHPATRPAAAGTGRSAVPAGVRLELDVASPSWVEVYAPGGKRLYYDLAGAGQTLNFDRPRGPITVFLGNVAGVRVKVNGAAFEIPDSDVSGKTARFEVTAPAPPAPSSSP